MADNSYDSPVHLYDLTFLEEDGEVVVGRGDTGSFGVFPKEGAELINRLAKGMTPVQTARWYKTAYGEELDLADFLATLHEFGFVREGDEPGGGSAVRVGGQAFARALFSWPAAIVAVALVAAAFWSMAVVPGVRPQWTNVFIGRYTTLSLLIIIIGQFPGLILHEAFHVLAGRRLGLPSKIRLGRRLIFLVVETQMNGLPQTATIPSFCGRDDRRCDVVLHSHHGRGGRH
jgi:hypothetical protein